MIEETNELKSEHAALVAKGRSVVLPPGVLEQLDGTPVVTGAKGTTSKPVRLEGRILRWTDARGNLQSMAVI